ncbi:hypothetical protein [Amycolatopsis magusensis]|uniref:Excreted virulence factor EspC, type VII ESX diderm n=1 Tax=Amycolatopsis magusensis TaxID=882444 RepID=A0ABS4PLJ1_9PSEU|nr:hypothetical protein [Amycolatopsis magusensis]MBP2180304.1 hypothetical protein [Amycolatopsis magusensis]
MNAPVGGDQGFNADPDEIDAHAASVASTHQLLRSAVDATQARLSVDAFGDLGFGLELLCNNTMEDAVETLRRAEEAGQAHADAVRQWAEHKRVDEEEIQRLLKKVEAGE